MGCENPTFRGEVLTSAARAQTVCQMPVLTEAATTSPPPFAQRPKMRMNLPSGPLDADRSREPDDPLRTEFARNVTSDPLGADGPMGLWAKGEVLTSVHNLSPPHYIACTHTPTNSHRRTHAAARTTHGPTLGTWGKEDSYFKPPYRHFKFRIPDVDPLLS